MIKTFNNINVKNYKKLELLQYTQVMDLKKKSYLRMFYILWRLNESQNFNLNSTKYQQRKKLKNKLFPIQVSYKKYNDINKEIGKIDIHQKILILQ